MIFQASLLFNNGYVLRKNQFNYLHASSGFICPGIAVANSLDPDQAQQNVGLDLRSKLFQSLDHITANM